MPEPMFTMPGDFREVVRHNPGKEPEMHDDSTIAPAMAMSNLEDRIKQLEKLAAESNQTAARAASTAAGMLNPHPKIPAPPMGPGSGPGAERPIPMHLGERPVPGVEQIPAFGERIFRVEQKQSATEGTIHQLIDAAKTGNNIAANNAKNTEELRKEIRNTDSALHALDRRQHQQEQRHENLLGIVKDTSNDLARLKARVAHNEDNSGGFWMAVLLGLVFAAGWHAPAIISWVQTLG